MKKEFTNYVTNEAIAQKISAQTNPIIVHFAWIEGNKRRDLDNVAFAKKFILDGLVKAGVLKNDNCKHVTGFTDTFIYDSENKDFPDGFGVIVRLWERK